MNLLLAVLLATIQPRAIKAHIDLLASDLLEGREAGSRGHEIAATYVATQFEAAGVEPAGDNGTYLQQVNFRTARLDPSQSTFCIRTGGECVAFEHRKDVLIQTTPEPMRELEADVVHAGFGIVAPELGHDDYAGIDVRGKIVAIFAGAPPRFGHAERAFYSDQLHKLRAAAERGAVGVLNLRTLDSERRMPWARVTTREDSASFRAVDGAGQPLESAPEIRAGAALGPNAAAALFRGSPKTLDELLADAEKSVAHSFPLAARASLRVATTIGKASSPNVIGVVRGSDSRLAAEYVVLTAHLDHLPSKSTGEDRVYNGALDNASGIAALIEIARKVAAMPRKPARSIVFAAVTAEEKGLQGSLAFAERPTLDGPIVANVNMDMLTMLFPMNGLVALGIDHSSLGPLARDAATRAGFAIENDPLPEEVRFIRSDQYSFMKRGIPAITYKGGFESRDPNIDGAKLTRDWLRNDYHSVKDGPDQKIDYDSGARWAEANCNLVVAIANTRERPKWNKGDFFGDRFGGTVK